MAMIDWLEWRELEARNYFQIFRQVKLTCLNLKIHKDAQNDEIS